MSVPTVFLPEAVFSEGALHRGRALVVSAEGRVLPAGAAAAESALVTLPGRIILPGFVNGHSHAFQRAIRGRTEFLAPGHERDDFWSWREAMYEAAGKLDPEQLYAVSKQAFLEMALAGITTVGEFHYLQHQPDGAPYADEHELARQVIRAARDVGLRIVLLRVGYARAGHQAEPNPRQRRFLDPDVDTFLRRASDLAAAVEGDPHVSVGLAPHSVRAVPRPWLEEIARRWRGPLHMHVAEQPGELRACAAEHGLLPVELLDAVGLLGPHFTAVHAVHLERREIDRLGQTQTTICACPSTERNLGDGIVEADQLLGAGARLSLGTDSQAHIDLLQEAQQLEGHLRLLRLRRNVLAAGTSGAPDALAARLLQSMTMRGAHSLGLDAGTLAVGEPADFVTLDLAHPSVLGAGEGLLARVVLGASAAAIDEVYVGGRRIVAQGRHAAGEETGRRFVDVMRALR